MVSPDEDKWYVILILGIMFVLVIGGIFQRKITTDAEIEKARLSAEKQPSTQPSIKE